MAMLDDKKTSSAKVKRWLNYNTQESKNSKAQLDVSPQRTKDNIKNLRDRLDALKNATGSFSSQDSQGFSGRLRASLTHTARPDAHIEHERGAFNIPDGGQIANSRVSNKEKIPPCRLGAPASPVNTACARQQTSRLGTTSLPGSRSTPTRAPLSQPAVIPRTPPPVPSPKVLHYNSNRMPGTPTPDAVRELDAQLGELDKLTRTLSVTAEQLSEECETKIQGRRNRVEQGPPMTRSAEAHWQKYDELAAQLEWAKAELERLDMDSDNEAL